VYSVRSGLSWKKLISVAPFRLVASQPSPRFCSRGCSCQGAAPNHGHDWARGYQAAGRLCARQAGACGSFLRPPPSAAAGESGAGRCLMHPDRHPCAATPMAQVRVWNHGGCIWVASRWDARVGGLWTDNCEPLLSPFFTAATRPIVSSRALSTHFSSCLRISSPPWTPHCRIYGRAC